VLGGDDAGQIPDNAQTAAWRGPARRRAWVPKPGRSRQRLPVEQL